MKKGSKKSPVKAIPRTKEEIRRDFERAQNRKLIIERFFPALEEATISVDEASALLQACTALIMAEAMNTLKAMKVKDIRSALVNGLAPNDERLLQIEKLIEIFEDMTLFEARGHFESMKAVIQQMQMDEMRNRKLGSLTQNWDRYLVK